MNWYFRTHHKKIVLLIFAVVFCIAAFSCRAEATVYVYEVVTERRSFQTASKLSPDAFLKYNGGEDVIYGLTVLKTYSDKYYEQALRDYELQETNYRSIPHTPRERTVERRPYFWWR